MAKKNWTPEERKAFGENMRAARAKKQTAETKLKQPEVEETISDNDDLEALKRQVEELKQAIKNQGIPPQTQQPQVTGRGLIGTFEKYILDPKSYPSPVDRLLGEPRLQRFAMPYNWELNYQVGVSQYQTKDGVNTKEPKFTLELIRIVPDEITGEPTNKRFVMKRMVFHEDPEAALAIANEQGLEVKQDNEDWFLNEMRYLRMRDWLVECFYPRVPDPSKRTKSVVFDNKVVEIYEVSSENPQEIPFSNLNSKI